MLLSKTELEKLIKSDDQSVKLVQKKKTGVWVSVRMWMYAFYPHLHTPTPKGEKADLTELKIKIKSKKSYKLKKITLTHLNSP